MPARIVVIYDEPNFVACLTAALSRLGHTLAAFVDPNEAADALEEAQTVDILITGIDFGSGNPSGVTAARIARSKRRGIQALFIGPLEFAEYIGALGVLLPLSATVPEIVSAVDRLMTGA